MGLFAKKIKEDNKENLEEEKFVCAKEEKIDIAEEIGSQKKAEYDDEEDLKKEFEQFKIKKILRRIDHTLLKQTATTKDIKQLCEEAVKYGFCAVCVQPLKVASCKSFLGSSSGVKIATVISFPFGEDSSEVKAFQTKKAVRDGADEIDMVMCISALKSGDYRYVRKDIKTVVKAARGKTVKVILETSLLTPKEIESASKCAVEAGASYIKTSTGYCGEGATEENVRLMKKTVGDLCGVKASGGIKTAEDAKKMIKAGADRIGTSNGVAIAEGLYSECEN